MAIWQMIEAEDAINSPLFADSQESQPGDPTFSTDVVKTYLLSLGAIADGFNYVGPSPMVVT